jgi:hypothetical protein
MDPRLNIGIGKASSCTIHVRWPSGKISEKIISKINTTIEFKEDEAIESSVEMNSNVQYESIYLNSNALSYRHNENEYNDFNREALNYHMLSTLGPRTAQGDINGDKIEDLIIPGPKGEVTSVYFGSIEGNYTLHATNAFVSTKDAEQTVLDLFDADGDGDLDLYAGSGGVELTEYSDLLYDELYLNDGKGNFASSGQKLPSAENRISTGAVCHADVDADGDQDLFVGERVKIGKYGLPCSGYILINDGKGRFTNATDHLAIDLRNIGMISDAAFSDLNGDALPELIVVGEFMDVFIFENKKTKFVRNKSMNLDGWWNRIHLVDIDNDNDLDIVLGNHGLNSKFKVGTKMYHNDFDKNGFPETIFSERHADGKDYPCALRHNLVGRLPGLKKIFPDFKSYQNATINEVLPKEMLDQAIKKEVNELESILLVNEGKMNFSIRRLPIQAQFSPVYAINHIDLNKDGFQDIVLGGNLYRTQPEVGRYDASYGLMLLNDKKGNYVFEKNKSDLSIRGEIRDIKVIGRKMIIFRNNDESISLNLN